MIWKEVSGKTISCFEKIKILEQNLEELCQLNLSFDDIQNSTLYQYALEDALLFNIQKQHFDTNLKSRLDEKRK